MARKLVMAEIYRNRFGNDNSAINRHSVRKYIADNGMYYTLDRTLDTAQKFFQIYGPVTPGFRGVMPTVKVDGQEGWGEDLTWEKAEKKMCEVLNARLTSLSEFLRKNGEEINNSVTHYQYAGEDFYIPN